MVLNLCVDSMWMDSDGENNEVLFIGLSIFWSCQKISQKSHHVQHLATMIKVL